MAAQATAMQGASVERRTKDVILTLAQNEQGYWQGELLGDDGWIFSLDRNSALPSRPGKWHCHVFLFQETGRAFRVGRFCGKDVGLFAPVRIAEEKMPTPIDRKPAPLLQKNLEETSTMDSAKSESAGFLAAVREQNTTDMLVDRVAQALENALTVPPEVVDRAKALAQSAPASNSKKEKARKSKKVAQAVEAPAPKPNKKKKEGWEAKSRRHQEGVFGK